MNKNIVRIVLIASILLISISNCTAAENEFGIVYAWSNDEPATVEGMILKINEPFTVKVTIESKIDGDICLRLYEPGVTNAYEVVEGPSEIDEFIKNLNIESGWKTTYIWKLKPNGDWTNGNAPINLFVQFNKAHDDVRMIDFTIANPHILDEQYSGFNIFPARATAAPSSTNQSTSQGSPGFGVAGAMLGILLAVVYRAGRA
ncbi:MAG: sarcinarray family MAST domain-containing protein [Methanosarcinales archaeon]|nr:sarcinarray family MAST domain-containing protein [Methanosarcinales archaeon]